MATRKNPTPAPVAVPATVPPTIGLDLLRKLVEKANELRALPNLQASDEDAWRTLARDYLVKTFGSRSPNVDAVIHASGDGGLYVGMDEDDYRRYLVSGFDNKIKQLKACIEQLETDISLQSVASSPGGAASMAAPSSSRVFVVHGHNHGAKEAVARFLEKLDLEPIVLHEKPNAGRTVIEKFSDYADVHFAVVLLTADDEGRAISGQGELRRRARQNVILELGYFLGRLGRSRVCALYEAGVEIPSDYSGILFVELDATDRWRFDLVKELLAAGFAVDANRIFSAS